ncbi:MAG TPA: phytanoyl-CoA dioxygenase family protein [Planctomycetaceae bacterium]|nr:phytanoyl-CoA dioxygenase family protein [Planctomycetaceae bacterium]
MTTTLLEPPPAPTLAPLFDAAELAQFQRDGYVIARGLTAAPLRERMLELTRRHLAAAVEPIEFEADLQYPGAPTSREAVGGRTVRRLKQAHSRDFVFTEWLIQPDLLGRIRQLLGPQVVVPLAHHNCLMTKQPHHSSRTGWHQDIRYWSFERPELVSVWLALGREHEANGCLNLVPGTHRMSFESGRFDEALFLRPDLPENQALAAAAVPAELEPGDVLFFHCRTFHAAGQNQTGDPKFSVVFTFRPLDNHPLPGSRSASLPELLIPPAS